MAQGRKPKPRAEGDEPRQTTGYRLRPAIQPLAEQLAMRRAYSITELVNEAVRKELEREGLWPPKSDSPPSE